MQSADQPYTGTLEDMFRDQMTQAENYVCISLGSEYWSAGKNVSVWFEYNGPDCASFKCYTRFAAKKITLANIFGTSNKLEVSASMRKGRMPKILDAAFKVAEVVVVESVTNPQLRIFLEGVGFSQDMEELYCYYKARDATE